MSVGGIPAGLDGGAAVISVHYPPRRLERSQLICTTGYRLTTRAPSHLRKFCEKCSRVDKKQQIALLFSDVPRLAVIRLSRAGLLATSSQQMALVSVAIS
jgi:hypothetical protein